MINKKKYKNTEEIELMRQSAQLVSKTLGLLSQHIQIGTTPLALDKLAYEYIKDHQAIPGFLGLYDFPNTLCISRNAEVVHGIPNDKPMEAGEIISIDCGVKQNGYYGDQAYTFPVHPITPEHLLLLRATLSALDQGIQAIKPGARVGDIGYNIQRYITPLGYGIVRELVGHGIGTSMHEKPNVPNYGRQGTGTALHTGMVLAIEPMITLGAPRIKELPDGWTIRTADNQYAAHYEHDVAITETTADVLSTFEYIDPAVRIEPLSADEYTLQVKSCTQKN